MDGDIIRFGQADRHLLNDLIFFQNGAVGEILEAVVEEVEVSEKFSRLPTPFSLNPFRPHHYADKMQIPFPARRR